MLLVTIDWLTATGTVEGSSADIAPFALFSVLRPLGLFVAYEERPGNRWYKRSVRCTDTGASIFWETSRSEWDVAFVASGAECARIGEERLSQIMEVLRSLNFKATRLDVAATFVGEPEFKREFDALSTVIAVSKTKRKLSYYKDANGYRTYVIGSRQSSYYCRVYDRPKEIYHGDPDSFRCEIEIKGDAAAKLFKAYSMSGVKSAGLLKMAGMLKPFAPLCAFALDRGREWDNVTLPAVGRQGSMEALKWYKQQVIPSLCRLKRENFVKFQEVRRLLIDALEIS